MGEITGVNPDILFDMLEKDYLPIIAPIGLDKDYHTYNINADDAACAIAKAVHAEKLAFLTDIEGLYKDINDKSTFISRLTASEAEGLIHDGYIGGGMLPKLNNCTSAIRNGVNRVHILDGRLAHCLPSRRLVRSKKYPAWIVSFSPIPVRKQWKVPLRLPENMRI